MKKIKISKSTTKKNVYNSKSSALVRISLSTNPDKRCEIPEPFVLGGGNCQGFVDTNGHGTPKKMRKHLDHP